MNKIEKSWSPEDWENGNIIADGKNYPKMNKYAQSQIRNKRKVEYQKNAGKVFYFDSNIINYYNSTIVKRKNT